MSPPRRPELPAFADGAQPEGLLDTAVELDDHHAAVVIRLTGEIDYYTAPTLREALDDALERGAGRRLLVIDLERVDFVASHGLAELVSAAERAHDAGLALRVAAPNRSVRMLIAVTGTGGVLALRPTVADALR